MTPEVLSNYDDLEAWSGVLAEIPSQERSELIRKAQPLWLKRMTSEYKVLFHPDTLAKISSNGWVPDSFDLSVIWANLLASKQGEESTIMFGRIKPKLKDKYGHEWWESTYKKIRPIYAAHSRLRKLYSASSAMEEHLVTNTTLFAEVRQNEINQVLKMVPNL